MSRIDEFLKLMKKSAADRVVLITNHYQITGHVYDCEECNMETFVNLTNATICMLNEVYGNQCDRYSSSCFDWLHVNLKKVVAFSFQKA